MGVFTSVVDGIPKSILFLEKISLDIKLGGGGGGGPQRFNEN